MLAITISRNIGSYNAGIWFFGACNDGFGAFGQACTDIKDGLWYGVASAGAKSLDLVRQRWSQSQNV